MVVVEVRRKRTRRRRRGRKEGKEGRNEEDGADIKSNNPHLTGGELYNILAKHRKKGAYHGLSMSDRNLSRSRNPFTAELAQHTKKGPSQQTQHPFFK